MRRLATTFTLAILVASLALTAGRPSPGAAQQAQATIVGAVHMLTPDVALPDSVEVQLIILEEDADLTSTSTETDASGAFAFQVDPDPRFRYIPFMLYSGVRYLGNAIQFDGSASTSSIDFEVYDTTDVAPDLAIESTTIIAVALERSQSSIVFIREDVISREEPTVFVGGDDGVTLRIPVPDRTLDASGLQEDDPDYSFEGGTINVSAPIRPGLNSIVTQYRVGYDALEDMYRLRVTSPLPTARIEAQVPERFVNKFAPADDATSRVADVTFEGDVLLVAERNGPAGPGQGLIVDLVGLSGTDPPHILTTTRGALVGSLLALVVIAGLAIALARREPHTEAPA